MGQSTDAILAYGHDLGADDDLELRFLDEDDDDVGGQIERRLRAEIASFDEEWAPESQDFFAREREADAATGVEVVGHCSCDYPMRLLAARGSVNRAGRGEPQEIVSLEVLPGWNERLAAARAALGLPEATPGWVLASHWC